MSSAASPAYDTMPLEQAYERVRSWYQANVERIREFKPNPFELSESPTLIASLPPTLSKLEMRAVLQEILDGLLEWGRTASDGNLRMESYARAGLDHSGGDFTTAETLELQKTSGMSRVLRHGYHKLEFHDESEERADGHRRFDSQLNASAGPAQAGNAADVVAETPPSPAQQLNEPAFRKKARPRKSPMRKARSGESSADQSSNDAPGDEAAVDETPGENQAANPQQNAPAKSGPSGNLAGTAAGSSTATGNLQSLPQQEPVTAPPTPKIVSDQWVKEDSLGYQAYARTLAGFITHKDTRPPLTIGLEAPWGAGKTSIMKMVQDMLDGDAALTEENQAGLRNRAPKSALSLGRILDFLKGPNVQVRLAPHQSEKGRCFAIPARCTVWFNAWKYQNSEQIWAGLAHCIINQVTARMDPIMREYFWLRLNSRRIDVGKLRTGIYKFVLQKVWPWLVSLLLTAVYLLAFGLKLIVEQPSQLTSRDKTSLGAGAIVAAVTALGSAWKWRQARAAKASEKGGDLLNLVREPDYEGKMGFLYLVESDVREVLDLVAAREAPLVIFIDDLDRCLPGKVAEVVEAISLFLAGDYPNCIFLLGMEPRMVAAALEVANKDLIARMGELGFADGSAPLGWRFMEKIIQLPLVLPGPTETGLGSYLNYMAPAALAPTALISAGQSRAQESSGGNLGPAARERADLYANVLGGMESLSMVVSETERLMATAPQEDRPAIAEASKRVYATKFDPQDPLVSRFLDSAINVFGANPRQVKRYVNMFRFCFNLRYALRLDAKPEFRAALPSDEAIAKYAVMSVQWPQATVLMRQGVESVDGESAHKNMLECLEVFAGQLKDQAGNHDQMWREFLDQHDLKLLHWTYTPSFRRLLGAEPSLSQSAGKGLW